MTSPRPAADATDHRAMLGARLARRLPGANVPAVAIEMQPQGLFLLWLAYAGLLFFGASVLWHTGAAHRLLSADPTGITLLIILLFAGSTLWCGHRAWQLSGQHQAFLRRHGNSWGQQYVLAVQRRPEQQGVAQALLAEHTHGTHEMAWWLNGIQLKLGLLGKVIGFSLLALELGQASFDAGQAPQLLRSLTGGLGIALLTTMTGLCGNLLLGLQLMRLDRFADALLAQALAQGLAVDSGHTPGA